MPDLLDKILRDLRNLNGSAAVGPRTPEDATKMARQEFGAGTDVHADVGNSRAPMRRTLTPTTDAATPAIFRAVQRDVESVLDGKGRGVTGQEIMADAGTDLAELVQAAVDGDTPPPLAESTAASRRRRGKDTRTLVDSGDMLRSIGVETSADPGHFEGES